MATSEITINVGIEDLDPPIDLVQISAKLIRSEVIHHPEMYDAFVMSIKSVLQENSDTQSSTVLAMKIANRILDVDLHEIAKAKGYDQ